MSARPNKPVRDKKRQ